MRYRAVVVLTLASLSIELSGAAPASAAALGFRLESATTSARGAPVQIRYTAVCSPAAGNLYTLRVTLAQRTGRTVATGRAEASERCSGRPHSMVLRAVPDTPGTTFRPGRMSVTSCLRTRNVLPSQAGRVTAGGDDPACTVEPSTAIVPLTEPKPLAWVGWHSREGRDADGGWDSPGGVDQLRGPPA